MVATTAYVARGVDRAEQAEKSQARDRLAEENQDGRHAGRDVAAQGPRWSSIDWTGRAARRPGRTT